MTEMPIDALGQRMGVRVVEATAERVVMTMPVEGNTQPYGLLHGGASCVLAEAVGSVGAALGAPPGRYPVGVDINATHHRGVREGVVTATGTPLHSGRTTATWAVSIRDEQGRLVCSARLTCALVEPRA